MISHFDSDHSKISSEVIEKLNVKNIIISKQFENTAEFSKTIEAVKKRKVNIIMVQSGDIVQIDKNTYFQILWPDKEFIKENAINNNSIVAKLYYKEFAMIFTGDIEELAEKKILNKYDANTLNSTVLKVAHHGSKSSSTEDFINAVSPKISVIGVGANNKFGHPNSAVVSRFKKFGAIVYRTDEDGEISITINSRGRIKVKKFINNM